MRLDGLFVYPVKGLRGTALTTAEVEPCGLAGDRRWMVVDAQGRFLTQRQLPAMARLDATLSGGTLTLGLGDDRLEVGHGSRRMTVTVWRSRVDATLVDPAADRWLGVRLGRPCRLVFLDDPCARPIEPAHGHPGEHVSFADGFPVLLTSAGSLDALNGALNGALRARIGMDRFRSNLVIGGEPAPAAWAEHDWSLLRIGDALFRAVKPCVRCTVPGIDQLSGETPDPGEPLRTLGRLNRRREGIVFGHNLVPMRAGRLAVGDRVEILEPPPA